MLKKTHLRLTLLGAGVTTLLLIVLSILYLFLSEKKLRDQNFAAFCTDMRALLSQLDEQSVITHEWLSFSEKKENVIIRLWDHGNEFLWGNHPGDKDLHVLTEACLSFYEKKQPHRWPPDPDPLFFSLSVFHKGTDHYAALYETKDGLTVLLIRPVLDFERQIRRQRVEWLLPILLFSLVLWLFFWYFTGRLLTPVKRSQESQNRFVAAASHELRSPLSVILSCAEAGRRCLQSGQAKEGERFFSTIISESHILSRLITDLLMLASADNHTLRLSKTVCEPDTLLLNVYEAYEPLAVQNGRLLSVSLPQQKTASVECDVALIHQTLSVLIHNAFAYTPPGSRITLSLTTGADGVAFLVADNGPGIPDAEKGRIFERFYRMDPARGQNGHFGLGLSIAAEIAAAHGGRLSVSDTPGGGATFILTLPVQKYSAGT